MKTRQLRVPVVITAETKRDRQRERARQAAARTKSAPDLYTRSVLTRAYEKAERVQALSREGHEAIRHAVSQFKADPDPGGSFIDHEFRELRSIGANPYDLLAARHDGMTLKQYLALPWPHPIYVKKYKAWKLDEPLELRQLRREARLADRPNAVQILPLKKPRRPSRYKGCGRQAAGRNE